MTPNTFLKVDSFSAIFKSSGLNKIGICVASKITDVVWGRLQCTFSHFDARFVNFGRIGN